MRPFSGVQGGPLMHVIAAKAVCFHEALQRNFANISGSMVNAKALARHRKHGYRIVSGGTTTTKCRRSSPERLERKEAQESLDRAGITVNKKRYPFDTSSPFKREAFASVRRSHHARDERRRDARDRRACCRSAPQS